MTIEDDVLEALAQALNFTLSRLDIVDILGLLPSQIGNALYRLKIKGLITNRLRGIWSLLKIYRKIRHCKRIVETTQTRKKREWNCDCEATSEGYVPYYLSSDERSVGEIFPVPPSRPQDATTRSFAKIINPKLRDAMLEELSLNGVFLKDNYTSIEPECQPRFFDVPRFCIDGTEWLDDLSGKFQRQHIVTVVFQNDLGRLYEYKRTITFEESDFYAIIGI